MAFTFDVVSAVSLLCSLESIGTVRTMGDKKATASLFAALRDSLLPENRLPENHLWKGCILRFPQFNFAGGESTL
jgi:hypothetical protein